MVDATHPLGKHKDSVWQELCPPQENTRTLYGRSFFPLRKTQGFCMVEVMPPLRKTQGFFMVDATPPSLGKHKDSVWQNLLPPQENTIILYGRSYVPLRKTQGFCMVEAAPSLGKHRNSAWQKLLPPWENTRILYGRSYVPRRKT